MRYFIEFRISSTLTQVSYLNWKKLLISLMKSLSYTFSSLVFLKFNCSVNIYFEANESAI